MSASSAHARRTPASRTAREAAGAADQVDLVGQDTGQPGVAAYRFGSCIVRLPSRSVEVKGDTRVVGPKVFDLLVLLLRERHRIVTHGELIQHVWGGRAVSDTVIARTVTRCRQAIDEPDRAHGAIRARWGQGYQFHGEVSEELSVVRAASTEVTAQPVITHQGEPQTALVVLRTQDLSANISHAWLSDGLPELLTQALSEDRRLTILPMSVVRELVSDADADAAPALDQARQVWLRHGSACVLATSLGWDDDHLRVRAELLSPDGSRRELPAVFDRDASALVRRLATIVDAALFLRQPWPVPLDLPDAFLAQAYVRGSQALERQEWVVARRLAEVVLDAAPRNLGAGLLLLRALARCEVDAALSLGERLLREAAGRTSPEYPATVHITLGQVLAHHPMPGLRAAAVRHMAQAEAIAADQPASDWTIRIQLALALTHELGTERNLAKAHYQRALHLATECGNRLRAAFARSNLAHIEHYEGRVAEAVRLQAPLIQEMRSLRLPIQVAFTLGMHAEAQRALGHLDEATRSVKDGLRELQEVGASSSGSAISYLAYAASAVSVESGDFSLVREALAIAGNNRRGMRPRQQVYQEVARARLVFHTHGWAAAKEPLDRARKICDEHGIAQMIQFCISLGSDMAQAADDERMVNDALADLRALPPELRHVTIEAYIARMEAWRAHRAGDVLNARRWLGEVATSAAWTRGFAVARLDAAWLAIQVGALDTAESFLSMTGAWTQEMPLGLLVRARLHAARGRPQAAASCLKAAQARWHSEWPTPWLEVAPAWGPIGPERLRDAGLTRSGSYAPMRLPSIELIRCTLPTVQANDTPHAVARSHGAS